jgi:hypothetical protein
LVAGCSGGAGSVPTSAQHVDTTNAAVSLRLDSSQFGTSSTARSGRSPEFIGASVNTVAYSFTPGPIAGSLTLSTCAQSGTPTVYTCTIGLPANTYNLTVTLKNGATAVGTGTATGIAIAPNATTPVSMTISPINAGPALAISGATSQFYVDGQPQTIATTLNELDPAGNVITTFYGPVTNYPTLTLSDSNGTTGVTLNGGTVAFSTPPSTQAGGSASIAYNGVGVNATSLALSVTDGTTSSNTVTIPYISTSLTGNPVAFATTGAGGAQSFTFAEVASTGGTPTFDTSITSGTTCLPASVTSNPPITGGTNALTAGAITYTLTATSITFAQCTITLTSVKDPNLTTTVTVKPSGGAGVTISSHAAR